MPFQQQTLTVSAERPILPSARLDQSVRSTVPHLASLHCSAVVRCWPIHAIAVDVIDGQFEQFLVSDEPNIAILPDATDGDGLVYVIEAGREPDIVCHSDLAANIEISRFNNGTFTTTLSGETNLLLFLI